MHRETIYGFGEVWVAEERCPCGGRRVEAVWLGVPSWECWGCGAITIRREER